MTAMEHLLDCLRTAQESFPEDHEFVRECRVAIAEHQMKTDGSVLCWSAGRGGPLCDYPSAFRALEAA